MRERLPAPLLVFKGGNCHAQGLLPDTRFSADVDFSVQSAIGVGCRHMPGPRSIAIASRHRTECGVALLRFIRPTAKRDHGGCAGKRFLSVVYEDGVPGLKTFFHQEIRKLDLLHEIFEPRHPVELAKAGEQATEGCFGKGFSDRTGVRRTTSRRRSATTERPAEECSARTMPSNVLGGRLHL